jgi:hypothetical protein
VLFRKQKDRCCGLCIHATNVDEDTVNCSKKGKRNYDAKCLFFSYDPCKRVPTKAKALDSSKYEEYDYSL